MVLTITILFLLLNLGVSDSPLLNKYEKQIGKVIDKSFGADLDKLDQIEFNRGELYRFDLSNNDNGYFLLAEVAACRLGGCSSYEKLNDDLSAEYFDLLLILDANKKIIKIAILDYFSEFGYEITSKKYLRKFEGKEVCMFSNETDGIDAISGATISSFALEAMIGTLCEAI